MVMLLVTDHADAGDQAKLHGDDERDPGNARVNAGQPDRPARAQRAGGEHGCAPVVSQ
jgi:hypothetical protein